MAGKRKRFFKWVLIILSPGLLFGLYVVFNLAYATLTDYQPDEFIVVEPNRTVSSLEMSDSVLSLMIWNIGFGGLGEEMDFFYDDGEMVRPTTEWNKKYTDGIYHFTEDHAHEVDFFLYQEVDQNSKRSYKTNQFEILSESLTDHTATFGLNYNVDFIPLPFTSPMGKVTSGLATYSRFQPVESMRIQFPGNYSWPNKVFFLDRCFLVNRYDIYGDDKQLLIINTHNSAYDDGTLKEEQMKYLKSFLLDEYTVKGNYIIVGGDWNQCPPDHDPNSFSTEHTDSGTQNNISESYLSPDWRWVYDERVATNRKLSSPYDQNTSYTTIIDFYLVSPNVDVLAVQGIDQKFAYSDHQPVYLKVKLKPNF